MKIKLIKRENYYGVFYDIVDEKGVILASKCNGTKYRQYDSLQSILQWFRTFELMQPTEEVVAEREV